MSTQKQSPCCALKWALVCREGATQPPPDPLPFCSLPTTAEAHKLQLVSSYNMICPHGTGQMEVAGTGYAKSLHFVFLCTVKARGSKVAPPAHNWVHRCEPLRCPPPALGAKQPPLFSHIFLGDTSSRGLGAVAPSAHIPPLSPLLTLSCSLHPEFLP